jgi:hypothetical protein
MDQPNVEPNPEFAFYYDRIRHKRARKRIQGYLYLIEAVGLFTLICLASINLLPDNPKLFIPLLLLMLSGLFLLVIGRWSRSISCDDSNVRATRSSFNLWLRPVELSGEGRGNFFRRVSYRERFQNVSRWSTRADMNLPRFGRGEKTYSQLDFVQSPQ